MPVTVLIVEDEPDVRMLWRTVLEAEGFAVEEAGSGTEAIEKARAAVPALALLDGRLPDRSGWEVLNEMVHDDVLGNIPVVMVTGETGMDQRARDEGASRCLTKPVSMGELIGTVRSVLGS